MTCAEFQLREVSTHYYVPEIELLPKSMLRLSYICLHLVVEWRCYAFSRNCLCVGAFGLLLLNGLTYRLYFWKANISSSWQGQG